VSTPKYKIQSDYDRARDKKQEQAGYPHPPASQEQAQIEEDMGDAQRDPWKRRYINRDPDLDQPVPQAGVAAYDRDRDMENDFAMRMALKGNQRQTRARRKVNYPTPEKPKQ
jgi:hypothetical protein